jgi:protein-S-isoprenylcysteine O-methyltransferase Ste14
MIIRTSGILLGVFAHLLLLVTVWFLFPFLMGGRFTDDTVGVTGWWWRDALLVFVFGFSHSLLLFPPVRDRVEVYLPGRLHGCFFTIVTCSSLLLLILCWQPSGTLFFQFEGWARTAVHVAYCLSWVALFYSVSLNGFGWQTGWTPYWAWLHRQPPPPRRFEERGAYRWLRHPVYLSFLGQIWFTPTMTADRTLFTGMMTFYIFIGSYLKDRRLLFFLGDTYREYQARVPGYPLGVGPLGRVAPPSTMGAEAVAMSQ